MNIDLFLTHHGENGLISDNGFDEPVSGVILDAETNLLTLEFSQDAEPLHLNIPIEEEYKERLLFSSKMQIGVLEDGKVSDHTEVPILYLNDPYGSNFGDVRHMGRPSRSLIHFEQFMKRCSFAQAVHRDDFGDEGTAGSVLQGVNPKALEYAPQLLRRQALEAGPKIGGPEIVQGLDNAPRAPGAYGPKGPGGMGGGGGGRMVRRVIKKPPPDSSDQE